MLRCDRKDFLKTERLTPETQHCVGRLESETATFELRQESKPDVRMLQVVAFHEAADTDRLAGRTITIAESDEIQAIPVISVARSIAFIDKGTRLFDRTDASVANVVQECGRVQEFENEFGVGLSVEFADQEPLSFGYCHPVLFELAGNGHIAHIRPLEALGENANEDNNKALVYINIANAIVVGATASFRKRCVLLQELKSIGV